MFSEEHRIIAELQVSGDGGRRREERECIYVYFFFKCFFTCFNILARDDGFSTGFIAELYGIHHTCFQVRHIHLHFLCLQGLHSLIALEHPDLERVVQSGTDKPGHFKAVAGNAEDSVVCNCRGIRCSPTKSWHRKSNISPLNCAILNPLHTSTLTVNRVRSSLCQDRIFPSHITRSPHD